MKTVDKERRGALRQIIARAWSDPAFKSTLLDDPKQVFENAGIPVPDNKKLCVVENTQDTEYFILPSSSTDGVLTDEQLGELGFFDEFSVNRPVPWTGCCDITVAPSIFPDGD